MSEATLTYNSIAHWPATLHRPVVVTSGAAISKPPRQRHHKCSRVVGVAVGGPVAAIPERRAEQRSTEDTTRQILHISATGLISRDIQPRRIGELNCRSLVNPRCLCPYTKEAQLLLGKSFGAESFPDAA